MKFSRYANRFSSASATVSLMTDLGDARRARGPVYMLGGGNPAHIPAVEEVFRARMQAIVDDRQAFGRLIGDYDSPQGNEAFITALAELLRRQYDWPVGPEHIALTNGSQSSFGLLFNALSGEFDDGHFRRVLLPLTPEYVGYADVGVHAEPIFESLKPRIEKLEDGFFKYRVDFDALDIEAQRHGAICVSRPTNPTGNVITDDELAELARRCENAGVPLIIDGAYGLPFPGLVFTPATPIWNEHVILCLSLSKLGLPGLRTGIVIGPPSLIELVRNANAINSLAPGRAGPELATELLVNGALLNLCSDHVRPYYQCKLDRTVAIAKREMADLPMRIHRPEGAIFIWLWFEGLPVTSQALYRALVKQGVYVLAGEHFYPNLTEDWPHKYECIRVNYAADDAAVAQGLKIIAQVARAAYQQADQTTRQG